MTPFVRDRFSWLAYFMLAYYAYLQAALGPLMPFLRAELHLNYSVAALHLSAFAAGMILAGLSGDRLARRVGRQVIFWGSGAGMALGAFLLMIANTPAGSVAAALVMGFVGSYLLVMIQAALADHHGSNRAIALTESNVVASIFAALVPLVIGLGEESGLGWRLALAFGMLAWLGLVLIFRRTPIVTGARATQADGSRRLPRRFWAYWLVILLSVSIEWCVVFWGADFLQNSVGLEKVTAATLMSVFFVAMVIGRVIGSRLTHRFESSRLLIYAIVVVGVGFPLFWLGRLAAINIAGLFVAGLGIANLFPMTLSLATSIDPEQVDTASARVSLASGLAILIAPQVLASFADRVGIFNAFGIAAALLAAAAIIVATGRHIPAPAVISPS